MRLNHFCRLDIEQNGHDTLALILRCLQKLSSPAIAGDVEAKGQRTGHWFGGLPAFPSLLSAQAKMAKAAWDRPGVYTPLAVLEC